MQKINKTIPNRKLTAKCDFYVHKKCRYRCKYLRSEKIEKSQKIPIFKLIWVKYSHDIWKVNSCYKNWKGNENKVIQFLVIFFRKVFAFVSLVRAVCICRKRPERQDENRTSILCKLGAQRENAMCLGYVLREKGRPSPLRCYFPHSPNLLLIWMAWQSKWNNCSQLPSWHARWSENYFEIFTPLECSRIYFRSLQHVWTELSST